MLPHPHLVAFYAFNFVFSYDVLLIKNTKTLQEIHSRKFSLEKHLEPARRCSTRKCCKIPLMPRTGVTARQFHQKSSTLSPVLSRARQIQGLYGLEPQPVSQRKSREKENLSESVRIKPSISACTVYDLSIKLKKFCKGISLSK